MRIIIRCIFALCVLTGWPTPAAAQADPNLNVRVSITFEKAKAADVMKVIADSAAMNLQMVGEETSLVTLTMSNVRVRTALDAVCESAGCKWVVIEGQPPLLKVTGAKASPKLDIKSQVSVHLNTALFEQAFRTLASALQMEIVIDGKLPIKSVTLQVKDGTTTTLLDALCKAASCTWRFDQDGKRLVISAK